MNLTITPNFLIQSLKKNIQYNDSNSNKYPNLAPLKYDTVSFGVGEKVLEAGAKRLPKKVGMDINKALEKPFAKFKWRLHEAFGDLIATEKCPELPLAGIESRIKSPESIAEKGGSRDCRNLVELTEKIQDLMGGRLEFRDVTKDAFQEVINRFEDLVKKGIFNITEIESYYAEPNLAYVSKRMLKSLVKTCQARNPIRVVETQHPAGYHGVHITVQLPKDCDNAFAEIQLIGKDSAALKYAQDPVYKFEQNKNVQKKYAPVLKILAPLKGDDETLKKAFKQYTRDAYIHQRRRKSVPFGEDIMPPEFLDIPWFLPKDLDYKNIYEVMKKCDADAKKVVTNKAGVKKSNNTFPTKLPKQRQKAEEKRTKLIEDALKSEETPEKK